MRAIVSSPLRRSSSISSSRSTNNSALDAASSRASIFFCWLGQRIELGLHGFAVVAGSRHRAAPRRSPGRCACQTAAPGKPRRTVDSRSRSDRRSRMIGRSPEMPCPKATAGRRRRRSVARAGRGSAGRHTAARAPSGPSAPPASRRCRTVSRCSVRDGRRHRTGCLCRVRRSNWRTVSPRPRANRPPRPQQQRDAAPAAIVTARRRLNTGSSTQPVCRPSEAPASMARALRRVRPRPRKTGAVGFVLAGLAVGSRPRPQRLGHPCRGFIVRAAATVGQQHAVPGSHSVCTNILEKAGWPASAPAAPSTSST